MPVKRFTWPRSRRLSGRKTFAAVYSAGVKQGRGPLILYSIRNDLDFCRWGLSVSRRVGTAVMRNRIKRLIRESIRLLQHDLRGGYDLVIVVRPHEPLILAEYQKLLFHLAIKTDGYWAKIP
jgi:ribonuclease P protein component